MKHQLCKIGSIGVRLAWIISALLIAILHGLSAIYAYLHWMQLENAATLTRLGVSIRAAAVYAVVLGLLPGLITAFLGALLFWRVVKSRNSTDRMAIFTAFMLLIFSLLVDSNTEFIPEEQIIWQAVLVTFSFLGSALFFVFIFIFPDGRFRPRWAKAIPYAFLAWMVSWIIIPQYGPQHLSESALTIIIAGWLLVAVGIQIYRYKWLSTPEQRQQAKLVALSLLFLLIVGLAEIGFEQVSTRMMASGLPGLFFYLLAEIVSNLIWLVFPAALVSAILRYHLWDIDNLINQALVYTSLTLILTGIYLAGVVVLQSFLRKLTGNEGSLAVVGSTLAIAAVAGPLRGRLQRFIDRRFYRLRYNSERALTDFSQVVREEVGLEQLGNRLLGAVETTIQPEFASLWLIGRSAERYPSQRGRDDAWRMLIEQD